MILAPQTLRPSCRTLPWPAGAAVLACLILLAHREVSRRSRTTTPGPAHILWAMPPITSVDFTAPPKVSSPTSTVARFSTEPLATVAHTVVVRRLHTVGLARIGSLYGP